MNTQEKSLLNHQAWKGKIGYYSKAPLKSREDLALAYTPGVASASLAIAQNPEKINELTGKANLIAVVSDGSAVLGLGNIGAKAALPVMEGKAVLFKGLADVDAIPLVLDTQNVDEIVHTIKLLAPNFGGINLEDIKAPQCYEIEERLLQELDIPVFHDDQHGTACVLLAALYNALKCAGKDKTARIVINGIGAAGSAIARLLLADGFENLILVDQNGILTSGNAANAMQKSLAQKTNPDNIQGDLKDAMKKADVFIGVSKGNLVSKEMVSGMNEKAVVFAMANPTPEIMPEQAREAGAYIVGSGRSDFANQINNVLMFPGLFRGLLDSGAKQVDDEMKLAAAKALADLVSDKDLRPDYIIVDALDKRAVRAISQAVKDVVERRDG